MVFEQHPQNGLDVLLEQVLREQDRTLIIEAWRCMRADALRMSFVAAWLAAAESLKVIFREMAVRDSQVGKIANKIKRKEQNHQSIDNYLLKKAAELGIIQPDDKQRLEHVYKMRCVYAHPYGKGPTEAEVLAALNVVVETVLSRPALLRHGYAYNYLDLVFEDKHFLDDTPEKVETAAKQLTERVDPSVHPDVARKALNRFEELLSDTTLIRTMTFKPRVEWFITGFLAHSDTLASLDAVHLLTEFPEAASRVFLDERVWAELPEQAQDNILSRCFFSKNAAPVRRHEALTFFRSLVLSNSLTKRQEQRFLDAARDSKLEDLAKSKVPLKFYIDRVITALQSHNWYSQNPAATAVRREGPESVSKLEVETQEALGRELLQAADGTATRAEILLEGLATETKAWPPAILRGMLLECLVHEAGEIRFKPSHLPDVLKGIGCLAEDEQEELYAKVEAALEDGAADERAVVHKEEYENTLEILSEEADRNSEPSVEKRLNAIKDKVEKAFGAAEYALHSG